MKRFICKPLAMYSVLTLLLFGVGSVWYAWQPTLTHASDHSDDHELDDPTGVNGAVDLSDLYAFVSPTDDNNAVFVLTVAPKTPAGVDRGFDDNARYELHFGDPSSAEPLQSAFQYQIRTKFDRVRVVGPGVDIQGRIGKPIIDATSGTKFFAGPRDDPFFADADGLFGVLTATGAFSGSDTLADKNVSAFVLEIPRSLLNAVNAGRLNVWAVVRREGGLQ